MFDNNKQKTKNKYTMMKHTIKIPETKMSLDYLTFEQNWQ